MAFGVFISDKKKKKHDSKPKEMNHAGSKTRKTNHLDSSNIFNKVGRADSKSFLPRQETLQSGSGKGLPTHTLISSYKKKKSHKDVSACQASYEKEIDKENKDAG